MHMHVHIHVCLRACTYYNFRANYNSLTSDICQVNISECQVRSGFVDA